MTTTRQRSRQERALDLRKRQLKAWRSEEHPRVNNNTSNADLHVDPETKVERCLADIVNLERKLGIIRRQPETDDAA